MDNQKIYDCIIIGAGISGLSFAHYLTKKNQDILILEKSKKVGGQIETQQLANSNFWYELGSHTCYNSYFHLLSIIKDLEFESHIQETNKVSYVIYAEQKIKSVFSQIKLLNIATHFPRFFFSKRTNKTVKEYFSPIVGKSNYTPLFSNLFRAVICQKADNYPAEMFLKKRNTRLKDFPKKYTFNNGLQSILQEVIEKNKIAINYDCNVNSITTENGIITLHCKSGNYKTRNIAIATDVQTASKLTKDINGTISERLSDLELSESETIAIVVKKEDLALKTIAGIIPLENNFMSVVSRDYVNDDTYREMTFHFEKRGKTLDEKIDIACSVLNLDKNKIINTTTVDHILPALKIKDVTLVNNVDTYTTNNTYMLGNYYYGLSLEDCVYRSYNEYKRYVSNNNL